MVGLRVNAQCGVASVQVQLSWEVRQLGVIGTMAENGGNDITQAHGCPILREQVHRAHCQIQSKCSTR